ncbi:MAG TPA: hypothetical protein VM430_10840 [Microbacterium sp.]|nr:hypothetical protein [Microbacterium sp.]
MIAGTVSVAAITTRETSVRTIPTMETIIAVSADHSLPLSTNETIESASAIVRSTDPTTERMGMYREIRPITASASAVMLNAFGRRVFGAGASEVAGARATATVVGAGAVGTVSAPGAPVVGATQSDAGIVAPFGSGGV